MKVEKYNIRLLKTVETQEQNLHAKILKWLH